MKWERFLHGLAIMVLSLTIFLMSNKNPLALVTSIFGMVAGYLIMFTAFER